MSTQPGYLAGYWIAGAAMLLVLVFAGVAERRRARRRDLDATGWVPWRGIQVAAAFGLALVLTVVFKR